MHSEATRTTEPPSMTSFHRFEGGETPLPKFQEGKGAGFSGSSAWAASARSMWKLSKKTDDEKGQKKEKVTYHYWTLEHTKSNYAPIQGDVYLRKHKQGRWSETDDKEDSADAFKAYQPGREHTKQEDTSDDDINPYADAFR